jgi:hypothetical protein
MKPDISLYPTGLAIRAPFFVYLKYLGVFPHQLVYPDFKLPFPNQANLFQRLNCNGISAERIEFESQGFFYNRAKANLVFSFLQLSYCIFQLVRYAFFETTSSVNIVGLVTWICSGTSAIWFGVKYIRDGDKMCQLLTRVDLMEKELFGKTLNSLFAKDFRHDVHRLFSRKIRWT